MTHHLDALSAVAISGAAVFGSKVSTAAAGLAADVTGVATPEWVGWLVGPFGTLVALALALRWLASRVDKSETRIETMHNAHAEKIETISHAAIKVTDKVSNSLDALVDELRSRPCAMDLKRRNAIRGIDPEP